MSDSPFRNSILAGDELIRDAIRSSNFTVDPAEGVTGWRIARDGSATFYNVTIGATGWFIDENGNASFNDVSVSGELLVGGESIADVLNRLPRGMVSCTKIDVNSSTTTGADVAGSVLVGRTKITDFDVTRRYKVGFIGRVNPGGSTPTYTGLRFYYEWDADATKSDTMLYEIQGGGRATATTSDEIAESEFPFNITDLTGTGTDLNVAVYVYASTSGTNVEASTYARLWVEDLGLSVDQQDQGGGGGTPPGAYVKTYDAQWTASWYSFGKRSTSRLYQGDSGSGGNEYSKMGFDHATIAADLAGSTITKVEVRVSNEHSWNASGLTARFGTHNNSTEPGGSSSTSGTFNDLSTPFNKGQTKYVTLANSVGEGFRDGTIKGLTMGRHDAGGTSDYGYFYGEGASSSRIPQIRISYEV